MKKEELIIIDEGPIDLPPKLEALVNKKIAEAEEELKEARLQIRWRRAQVDLVKEAAKLMGIPFETYAKQVLYRQAIEDIERGKAALK